MPREEERRRGGVWRRRRRRRRRRGRSLGRSWWRLCRDHGDMERQIAGGDFLCDGAGASGREAAAATALFEDGRVRSLQPAAAAAAEERRRWRLLRASEGSSSLARLPVLLTGICSGGTAPSELLRHAATTSVPASASAPLPPLRPPPFAFEERGIASLRHLSPRRQFANSLCLVCWREYRRLQCHFVMHICVCKPLLKSV